MPYIPEGMDPPQARIKTTQHTVSCLPEDSIDRPSFEVIVEYRGCNRWAVLRNSRCLGHDGSWDYEMLPSSRDEEWLTEHRFTEQEALRRAVEWAPKITCNGTTVTESLAFHHRTMARLKAKKGGLHP